MSSLFAFPGQGAQRVGMLHELPGAPTVRACLVENPRAFAGMPA
ncbi:hypothetical protein [Pseudomonas sp. UBA6562]|nr:hypothetical protein [Pseudomonas sp. UBA6562]